MNTLLTTLVLTSILVVPTEGEYIPLEKIVPVPKANITPLECGIERVVPLETMIANLNLGNGLESFLFSTVGGKKPDFEMLIPEGDENRYPLFYRVDRDFDGFIDIVYVDDKRDGTCKGVRVYWLPKEQPPTNRHQGDPIPEGEQCEQGKEA